MTTAEMEEFIRYSERYLRNVAVDNVIFGYHDKELKVLLQQPMIFDKWTVTGGYIEKNESIEQAADRIAFTRTGLKNLFLEQFRSFGSPDRSDGTLENAESMSNRSGIEVPVDFFIFDRFISIGFYTLTEFSKVEPKKSTFDAECQWWPVNDLPPLMFDHRLIVNEALKTLRLHIAHYPVGYELLPEKFTLPEIHSLYETILGKTLDDRNFSKRLMTTGVIIKLNETRKIGAHRSPFLYKFDKEKYEEGLKSGVVMVF